MPLLFIPRASLRELGGQLTQLESNIRWPYYDPDLIVGTQVRRSEIPPMTILLLKSGIFDAGQI
jgi:hypothetical protein